MIRSEAGARPHSTLSILRQVDARFEFPRSRLVLDDTLGEGEFGRVVAARALDVTGGGYTR